MNMFKMNEDEQAENQMLNNYIDELAENTTLNRAFDQIAEKKYSLYLKPTEVFDTRYRFIIERVELATPFQLYDLKKLIHQYPCDCDNKIGFETIHIKFIPKLLRDFTKNNIEYNIHDKKAYEIKRKRGCEPIIKYDYECDEYSKRLRVIDSMEFQANITVKILILSRYRYRPVTIFCNRYP